VEQIVLHSICKTFKVAQRPQGRFAALRGAFVRNTKIVQALDNVSFTINQGELIGYIGPNGAGKSTTVKIMSGILTPDSGECRILGRVPWQERVKHVANIGVVFGQRSQLWWDVPVKDSFDLLKEIYNIPLHVYAQRLRELADALQIGVLLPIPVRQLSLGQRVRCEIAASLLHSPQILFLDEPTIGLDAVSKLALREFPKLENKTKGITMILTTHDMADIEALCPRVLVIGRGRILFDGALSSLKQLYAPLRRLKAQIPEQIDPFPIPGAEQVNFRGNTLEVLFDPGKIPAHVLIGHLSQHMALNDLVIEEQDIEAMVAKMYKELRL
jgi:ABC-2 type transport system ATP-binding protein